MKKSLPFFLIILSLFLLLISPNFLSRGMFIDGIVYSNFSKNFALGLGSFLHPYFSPTYLLNFKSHPPMFFFIEGLFFKIFGLDFYIEKVFSVLCILISGFLMVKLYIKLGFKVSFLPFLFFVSIPLIFWSATNNIIENALMIFTTLSVLLYIYSLNKKRFFWIFLSGLSIAIGFSLKGFVALFPLSFPFIYWLVARKLSLKRMIIDTLLIVVFTCLPIIISIFSFPDAKTYFESYFKIQIMGSITIAQTVDSRFYIIGRFLSEIITPIIIIIIFLIINKKKNIKLFPKNEDTRIGLAISIFSLTAILPIMITMKQSGFYMLPAFPFISIGIASIIDLRVKELLSKLEIKSKLFHIIKYSSFVLLFISFITCFSFYNSYSRDKELLSDIDKLASHLPSKALVNIPQEMRHEYSLIAYSARNYNISIDPNITNNRRYLLVRKEIDNNQYSQDYKRIELETKQFYLYERKK